MRLGTNASRGMLSLKKTRIKRKERSSALKKELEVWCRSTVYLLIDCCILQTAQRHGIASHTVAGGLIIGMCSVNNLLNFIMPIVILLNLPKFSSA